MQARKQLLTLIKPYLWRLLSIVLLNAVAIFFSILTFMLIEPFAKLIFKGKVDDLSVVGNWLMQGVALIIDIDNPLSSLTGIVVFVILLFVLKNLFFFLAQVILAPVRSDFIRKLRNEMYDKVLILPLSFFSEQKKGDIISRAINDTQEIEYTVLAAIKQLLTDPIIIIFYVVTLTILNFQLTLFVFLLLPIVALLIGGVIKSLRTKSKSAKNKLGELLAHIEETILGLRIIKGFNAQKHAETVFEKQNREYSLLQQKIHRRVELASPLSEFLGITMVMIVLVIGGVQVLNTSSSLTPELFITYIALFSQVINPAKNISTAFANYKRGASTLDRLNEILEADEVIEQKADAINIKKFKNNIVFKDVDFSYSDIPVLKKININIEKGELVALVGESGAGKSTLADLLLRFYDVTSGSIMIDGIDIRDYVIDDLRSLYSVVTQDVILFNDTIFSNIAFGLKDVSESAVHEAAKMANAYDFIMQLPDKFMTVIGDRGLTLSGGQRQRISIARAILRNADILVLDEATSAMDTESEKLVQEALDNVMKNRTSIVIAHRLSTIQHADKIIVITAGEIVEQGSHQELLDLKGKYYDLLQIQYAR
ncbi:MAG TPA: ABC transporter transmembrane domain-containing protein [Bacteroidales bacterium]|nr:ABC transporter transmembrane domain-containing protein [Bacteroidales bacterium]HRT13662.1 ABC transporter transmembrane domain-containing protein [Bacteroidales bacterium]